MAQRLLGEDGGEQRQLLDVPGVSTMLTGGQLRATAGSLTGMLAADLLTRVHASIGFFGSRGLTTPHGLTDVIVQEVEMKAAMARVCERVVAVVDHTKLGAIGLATSIPLSGLHLVITDIEGAAAFVARLRYGHRSLITMRRVGYERNWTR